ncbi:hypothetical protein BH10PSE2_BH10PSE2_15890 [soil metagenome]
MFSAEWARNLEEADLHSTAALNRQPDLSDATSSARLTASSGYTIANQPGFGADLELQDATESRFSEALAASTRRDVWSEAGGHVDRLRLTSRGILRRADGSPLPPTLQTQAELDNRASDVSFTRGWPVARGRTPSGLDITLTPHAGLGMGDSGGSAEAGATIRIGKDLERLVPDGSQTFGERSRWYVYAAGSGRAVGYNFARTRDGDFARSGVSQDEGHFLGDASVGVAMRRGDMQTSFGVVYREIKAEGMRGGDGIDRDVSEGLVAFQFSIRPH